MLVMHPDVRGRSPFRRATQNHRPLGCHLRSPDGMVPRKSETCTVRRAYCTVQVFDATPHRANVKPTVYSSSNGRRGFQPENDLLIKENMREVGARKSFFFQSDQRHESLFFFFSTSQLLTHCFSRASTNELISQQVRTMTRRS